MNRKYAHRKKTRAVPPVGRRKLFEKNISASFYYYYYFLFFIHLYARRGAVQTLFWPLKYLPDVTGSRPPVSVKYDSNYFPPLQNKANNSNNISNSKLMQNYCFIFPFESWMIYNNIMYARVTRFDKISRIVKFAISECEWQ